MGACCILSPRHRRGGRGSGGGPFCAEVLEPQVCAQVTCARVGGDSAQRQGQANQRLVAARSLTLRRITGEEAGHCGTSCR
ncbi:hypothetical protein Z950_3338 [Sulfitobacter mediterraneus KCTC 32188]|nr:hypothetical protein Z950_3338 [Sulfitobacter mediterraneus KCTC 32188]